MGERGTGESERERERPGDKRRRGRNIRTPVWHAVIHESRREEVHMGPCLLLREHAVNLFDFFLFGER